VRKKNASSILIKNLIDLIIGCLGFWLIGFGLAFGGDVSGFVGYKASYFAGSGYETEEEDLYLHFLFQFAFANTAATIVSGCLAERIHVFTYALFSFLMTSFIYPIVVHWYYHPEGWLFKLGIHDYSGSGAVHALGGFSGLVACWLTGKRHGLNAYDWRRQRAMTPDKIDNNHTLREIVQVLKDKGYDEHSVKKMLSAYIRNSNHVFKAHNNAYLAFGTFMLWVSWFFYNGGTTLNLFAPRKHSSSKIIVNTALGGATGGLVGFFKFLVDWDFSRENRYSIGCICNGILAGIVSVTSSVDNIDPWAAMVIASIGSVFYQLFVKLLKRLSIDDPVEASCVHFAAGSWGIIATGFFDLDKGLFYDHPDKG
jgi:Amt family ammonium transporter